MRLVVGMVCIVVMDMPGITVRDQPIGLFVLMGMPVRDVSVMLHCGQCGKPV